MQVTEMLRAFAYAAAPVAVEGFWQGLAVVLAVALCMQCARRMPASLRFALWAAGFLAAVALPFAPSPVSLTSSIHAQIDPSHAVANAGSVPSHTWFQWSAAWAFAIAVLWIVASLARAVDLVVHVIRLAWLWRTATPVESAASAASARAFQLCRTEFLERPSVIGFFQPRVLIPGWLLPKLTSEELDQIVLHESTHLTRRDDWTNLFQKICLVLFPLNPALWWMDRQLAREREIACDEAVVRATRAPRAYAACLTGLAEHGMTRRREALSLGAWQRRPELVGRVHRILRAHRTLSPVTARILLGAFGCGLAGVSIELARCPQLVEFVPRVASIPHAQLSGNANQLADAVLPTNPRRELLTAGARIVQARAEMPAAAATKPFAGRARNKTAAVGELRAASSEPGSSSRNSHSIATQGPIGSPAQTATPQFIVFTAWEEIDTGVVASQAAIADYETPAADGAKSDAAQQTINAEPGSATKDSNPFGKAPVQNPTRRRTTFTQLILRVVPPGSQSTTPAAIPIGGGWFVIQL